jgi:hypothetical protein
MKAPFGRGLHCGNSNPPDYKKCLSCQHPKIEDNVFIE